jgi:lipoate-protein ligase A
MASPLRLLSLGSTHWLRTQSVYHALAETMRAGSPDTIIFAQPAQAYLCIGYHQELASVLDRAACEQMGLPIVRRRVGGGATYLDANQLFYQCVFHHSRVPPVVDRAYAMLLAAPVATLRALSLNAELRGENEIEVGCDHLPSSEGGGRSGKRIAGIGGGRIGEAAVVVGNLLFDFDYEAMTRAWRVPSESFRRLAAGALRERVTTLRAELPHPISADEVEARLVAEFARALGRPLERGELTEAERRKTEELEKRLTSAKWLNLHANGARPMSSLKISRGVFIRAAEAEVGGYRLRAAFRVRDGMIEQALLESEPERDWAEEQGRMRGVKIGEWLNKVREEA